MGMELLILVVSISVNVRKVIWVLEFLEAMYRNKSLFEKCKTLFEPNPLMYINIFKSLPSSFRTSTLYPIVQSGKFVVSKFVTPKINASGINFLDLSLDTCSKN